MVKRAVRIVSWNARSHDRRQTTIDQLLLGNDMVMVQETKLKRRSDYDEKQYTAYFTASKESENAKRCLLTICRRDVDSCEIPTPAVKG
jgi:hypothetical protein